MTTLLTPFAGVASATETSEPLGPRAGSVPAGGTDERRFVVAVGHDDELWLLWLRLDMVPSPRWVAAFDAECRRQGAAVRLHGAHVLCTATEADQRRVTKQARRIVGATNGAVTPR